MSCSRLKTARLAPTPNPIVAATLIASPGERRNRRALMSASFQISRIADGPVEGTDWELARIVVPHHRRVNSEARYRPLSVPPAVTFPRLLGLRPSEPAPSLLVTDTL